MQAKRHLVIVGAGFGGLSAALTFAEAIEKGKQPQFDITVIDKNDYQLYTPDLYEIAAGSATIQDSVELKKTVCIDVKLALAQYHIRFLSATVNGVNRAHKTVETSKGVIGYDYLLLSPGSIAFDYGIPGIAEHAVNLKTAHDALQIRESIMERVQHGLPTRIAVCGAGPAGSELAAELAFVYGRESAGLVSVALVDGGERVLGAMSPAVSRRAEKRLQKLNVELHHRFRIASVTADSLTSTTGDTLAADIIIWTGGVTANPLMQALGLELNTHGQLPVAATFQSAEDSAIFAIGDSAQIPLPGTDGVFAPQTAYEAVTQGEKVAWNILLHDAGGHLQAYHSRFPGYVVALGGKYGVVALPKNIVLSGRIGYLARKIIDFNHFRSVLPFMQACAFWYTGMQLMNKNDSSV